MGVCFTDEEMSVVVETVKMRFVRYRIRDPADVQDIRSTHHVMDHGGKMEIGG